MKINKVNNKKCRGLIGKEYQKGMPNYAQNNRILKFDVGVGLASTHAITLISLVITIIVLIILSSVAIYLSLGNNGIFTRAKEAREVTNKQQATDIINLKITTAQMNKYAEKQEMPTLQELADILYEDNEIEYIALETKVGEKEKITVGNNTSIFTKLNQYPYEFEINSSLQLASINGVKIATSETQVSTSPNEQNTMSSQEHFIGEYYYNGKPIYERSFYIKALPNVKKQVDYKHGIENVDEIWYNGAKSYGKDTDGSRALPYPYVDVNSTITFYNLNKNTFSFWVGIDRSNIEVYITLNYTKTTDIGNDNKLTTLTPN